MRRVLSLAAVLAGVLASSGVASALPAGSLDPSFGGGSGMVTPDVIAGAADAPIALAVDSQGRSVGLYGVGSGDVNLARFKPDGALDPSFDGDDVFALVVDHAADALPATGIRSSSTGEYVVAYWRQSDGWFVQPLRRRRRPGHELRRRVRAVPGSAGNIDGVGGMALDGDEIVLVGADAVQPDPAAVLKLAADGGPDDSFNSGDLDTIEDYARNGGVAVAAAATPDHELVVLGLTGTGSGCYG